MKPILIISGSTDREKEYARMISLELSAHGFQTTEKREDGLPAAVVAVYGTVGADEAAKATEQFNHAGVTVTVLANECIGRLPSGIVLIERPVDTERFCDLISVAAEKGKAEAQKLKGFGKDLEINRTTGEVVCRGEIIDLTSRERSLLLYLDSRRGSPVSREDAIRDVWGFEFTGETNVVDVYIRYIRKKLDERFDAKFIVAVRGKGYMLR